MKRTNDSILYAFLWFYLATGLFFAIGGLISLLIAPSTRALESLTVGLLTSVGLWWVYRYKIGAQAIMASIAVLNGFEWIRTRTYLLAQVTQQKISPDPRIGPDGLMVDQEMAAMALLVAAVCFMSAVIFLLPISKQFSKKLNNR